MNTWFVILLAFVAVGAITVLLYFALFDDASDAFFKPKHKRGDYINDQTAVIVHSIKETVDSAKAYELFAEYIFTNHKQFLNFLKTRIRNISDAYNCNDNDTLREEIQKLIDMKVELKDQVQTQAECLDSIDSEYYIETAAWINIANNTRFDINKGLRRIAEVCIHYDENYDEPFPQDYADILTFMVDDICLICDRETELINANDVDGMRELRKSINVIMSETYDNTSRLYDLLHDGRNVLSEDRKMALKYVLNAIQECYCIIYSLRRFILCNLCIAASRHHLPLTQ